MTAIAQSEVSKHYRPFKFGRRTELEWDQMPPSTAFKIGLNELLAAVQGLPAG